MPKGLSRAALEELAGSGYAAAAAQGSQYRPAERRPLSRAGLQKLADYKPPGVAARAWEETKGLGRVLGGAAVGMGEFAGEATGIPGMYRAVDYARGKRPIEKTGPYLAQREAVTAKAKEILSPEEEKRAAGTPGLHPKWQRFERAAKLLGLPLEALGIPVVSTGEALGRAGAGEPGAIGEAAGLAGFTALGGRVATQIARGRGVPAPEVGAPEVGAPGPVPRAGAGPRAAPGVGPRAPGAGPRAAPGPRAGPEPRAGKAPSAAGKAPAGRPRFFWEHEAVDPGTFSRSASGGAKFKTDKGKTVEVDWEAFQAEVNRQGEYYRFNYRGKTVVDHKLDPSMKRHTVWFEDGTQGTIPHAEAVRASGGRWFRQGARPGAAPEEGPIPPPPREAPRAAGPAPREAPSAGPGPRAPGPRAPAGPQPLGVPPPGVAMGAAPRAGPRPVPPGAPAARVVRPRAGRAFTEFDPEAHSLSDAAIRRGISFGKGKPIPQLFREALKLGKGKKTMAGQFRNEQTGVPVDVLLEGLRTEDGFPFAEDMPAEDLLLAIARDWLAKASGGEQGRTWSGMRQFQEAPGEGPIPPPPPAEEGIRALPEISREEVVQRIDDAVQKGDPDAEYQWRERLAILDEQAPLEPGAMDFPPSEAQAGIAARAQIPEPAPAPGTVRLYHGAGGPAAGGAGGDWFTTDSKRAASFGPDVGYVDVPETVFQQGQAAARAGGSGTSSDAVLPAEWTGRTQPADVAPDVLELEMPPEAPPTAGPAAGTNIIPPPPEGPPPRPPSSEVPPTAATRQGLLSATELRNAKLSLRAKGHLFPSMQAVRAEALTRRGAGLTGPPETDPIQPGQEGFIDLGDIIRAFRPKRRKPPPSTPEYDQILKDRELARAVAPWPERLLEWATDLPTEIQRRIFNQDVRIHKLADEIQRATGRKIPPGQDPRVILDLVRGGTSGRMLWSTLKIAEARKAAVRDDLLDYTRDYLDLTGWRRAIQIIEERMADAFAKGDHQTVAELRQRIAAGEVAPQKYTTEKINAHLEELEHSLDPAAWELVQHHADALWDINRKVWDLLHDQEVISEAVWQQGISRGKEYVPLYRIHEAFMNDPEWAGFSSLNAAARKALKRLEGSTLSTMDPYGASHVWTTRAIRDAAKNEAMRVTHDLKNLAPKEFGDTIVDLATPDAKPPIGYSKITYYVEGNKRAFAMPTGIAQSLLAVGPQEIGILRAAAQVGRRALQIGAVSWNIAFAAPNVPRDIGRFWAMSKASKPLNPAENARLLKSLGQGLGHVIRQDPWYMEMLWHRAAGSTLGKQLYPEVWMETPWTKTLANKVIHTVPEIINVTEEWSKMASFRKLREMGFGPEEAAQETRRYAGTPDWGRRGADSAMLNLIYMFFNVGMQGKAAAIGRWRRMPARFFVTGVGMSLAALSLYAWNAQFRDEEGDAEWNHVPRWDKKTNWVILTDQVNPETGRHAYYMIRKPEELQAIYNPIETGLWEVAGETELETRDYYQMLIDSASAVVPGAPDIELTEGETVPHAIARNVGMGLNPVLSMPIEQGMGVDLFRNRPQVPRRLQDVDPRYQFTPRTSPTAVVAGQATGISPMRIEHGFRSLGGLGEQVLGVIDPIAERYSPQKPGLYRGAEETPVVGSVIRRVFRGGFNDQVMRDYEELFYSYYHDANEVVATVRELQRNPEEMWKYLLDDPKRMILRDQLPMLQEIASNLSKLRELRRDVLSNPAMDNLEKGTRSREILDTQMQLVQQATMIEQMIEEATMNAAMGTPPPLVGEEQGAPGGITPPPR